MLFKYFQLPTKKNGTLVEIQGPIIQLFQIFASSTFVRFLLVKFMLTDLKTKGMFVKGSKLRVGVLLKVKNCFQFSIRTCYRMEYLIFERDREKFPFLLQGKSFFFFFENCFSFLIYVFISFKLSSGSLNITTVMLFNVLLLFMPFFFFFF